MKRMAGPDYRDIDFVPTGGTAQAEFDWSGPDAILQLPAFYEAGGECPRHAADDAGFGMLGFDSRPMDRDAFLRWIRALTEEEMSRPPDERLKPGEFGLYDVLRRLSSRGIRPAKFICIEGARKEETVALALREGWEAPILIADRPRPGQFPALVESRDENGAHIAFCRAWPLLAVRKGRYVNPGYEVERVTTLGIEQPI